MPADGSPKILHTGSIMDITQIKSLFFHLFLQKKVFITKSLRILSNKTIPNTTLLAYQMGNKHLLGS